MSTISEDYQEHLRKEHTNSRWGSSGAKYSGTRILEILGQRPQIKTVLDFGAGKGSLGKLVKSWLSGIEWYDYDPAVDGIDVLPSGQFDCVVSTDMLEHVEPERLDGVLRLMASKARQVLISDIACYPTGKLFGEGPYKGLDMHLIVEEPQWWRLKFNELDLQEFEYVHYEKRNKGRTKVRCFLVHERV